MNKLNILWTSDNKETVINMLAMYATNSKAHGWWEEVNVIIWGASAKLVAEDQEIQALIKEMQGHGVNFEACKACSDSLCVSEGLSSQGIDVRYLGQFLTDYLKSGEKLLTI
jgi:hypothetical protein